VGVSFGLGVVVVVVVVNEMHALLWWSSFERERERERRLK